MEVLLVRLIKFFISFDGILIFLLLVCLIFFVWNVEVGNILDLVMFICNGVNVLGLVVDFGCCVWVIVELIFLFSVNLNLAFFVLSVERISLLLCWFKCFICWNKWLCLDWILLKKVLFSVIWLVLFWIKKFLKLWFIFLIWIKLVKWVLFFRVCSNCFILFRCVWLLWLVS